MHLQLFQTTYSRIRCTHLESFWAAPPLSALRSEVHYFSIAIDDRRHKAGIDATATWSTMYRTLYESVFAPQRLKPAFAVALLPPLCSAGWMLKSTIPCCKLELPGTVSEQIGRHQYPFPRAQAAFVTVRYTAANESNGRVETPPCDIFLSGHRACKELR
jgi:hypothetical protein